MKRIVVNAKDVSVVAQLAFPAYRGSKHQIQVTERYSVSASELCWSGGSVKQVVLLRQCEGQWQWQELTALSPWSGQTWSGQIPDDVLIVEHIEFCGKDLGLRYNVSPTSKFLEGVPLLPPSVELSTEERTVLNILCGIKPSYRKGEYERAKLRPAQVDATMASLVSKGLAKKTATGAVGATTEGRNVRESFRGY
jgi:hypothetical protein